MMSEVKERVTYIASAPLQPLLPFRFECPDEWPKWSHRFEQFRIASEEDEEHQISILLHCLGEDLDDVLTSTKIFNENSKRY